MNSTQRAKKRSRRSAARVKRAHDALAQCLDFERVFSFESLYAAACVCRRGVMWKDSVISFDKNRSVNAYRLHEELMSGTYRKGRPTHFTILERGKPRNISAVPFRDRVVQRALCDASLVPIVSAALVYDNAASLKGKGTSFARRRFVERLEKAQRKWDDPYVAVVDYSNYFGSIDSCRVFGMLRTRYLELASTDAEREGAARILAVLELFICEEGHLGLGNQTSQAAAIWYLNAIDHRAGAYGYYGRYMDDAYCICETRQRAEGFVEDTARAAAKMGLALNPKKTRVVPAKRAKVSFLKRVYSCVPPGPRDARPSHPEIRMAADAARASRRHLKGVAHLAAAGVLDGGDVAAVRAAVRANCSSTSHSAGLGRKLLSESGLDGAARAGLEFGPPCRTLVELALER